MPNCRMCNSDFYPLNKSQKFCSDFCRIKYLDDDEVSFKSALKNIERNFPKKLKFAILARDKFRCVYCGIDASGGPLEIDHVFPARFKGQNSSQNIVTSCQSCNDIKHDQVLRPDILKSVWDDVFKRVLGDDEFITQFVDWKKEIVNRIGNRNTSRVMV